MTPDEPLVFDFIKGEVSGPTVIQTRPIPPSTDSATAPFSTMFWWEPNVCTECRHDAKAHVEHEGRYHCTATVNKYRGGSSFSGNKGTARHPGLPPSSSPGTLAYSYPCTCIREEDSDD